MKKTTFLKPLLTLTFSMAFLLIPHSGFDVSAASHTCGGVTYDKALDSSFTGDYLTSGNYYLTENIELTDTLEIAAGSDVKICLNGKNITGQPIYNYGTLTLNNCNTAQGCVSIYYGYNSAVLNGNAVIDSDGLSLIADTSKINGCTFKKVYCCDSSEISNGTFNAAVNCFDSSVITGGTFNSTVYCDNTSNISGGTFKAAVYCYNSSVITGGYFGGRVEALSQKSIKGGYFKTSPDESYIADGYDVTASGDSNYPYKVVKGHICGGVAYDKALDSSFTGGDLTSGNYYLTEDITLTSMLTISAGSDVKICLNGKNVRGVVSNNDTLTLNNCNTAKGSISRYWGKTSSVLNGNAVIDSDDYSQISNTSKINGCTFNTDVLCRNSSEISNGTFNATVRCYESSNISGGTFNTYVYCADSSVITGGYFGGHVGIISGSHQKFISGGYFKTSPYEGFIADGYVVTASGDSNYPYKVVKGHACNGVTYDKALDSSFTGGTLASGNYYLTGNISLTSDIVINRGSSVKICLNGKNITGAGNSTFNGIYNCGTLTLNNCNTAQGCVSRYYGERSSVLNGNAVIDSDNNSQITATSKINGCTFNTTVVCHDSSEISDGTFNARVRCIDSSNISGGTFNADVNCADSSEISGGTFNADVHCAASSEISGGTFNADVHCSEISGGYFGGNVAGNTKSISGGYFKTSPYEGLIADGYVVTASGDSNYPYKVVKGHICGGVTYDKALDSSFTGGTLASGNYYLTEDIELTDTLEIAAGSDVKICLNGKNITGAGNSTFNSIYNYGTLTLNNCNTAQGCVSRYHGEKGSVLNGNAVIGSGSQSEILDTSKINGCTFNGDVDCYGNSEISGGYFGGNVTASTGSTKFIKGGYFKTSPNESYIADGYIVTASGDSNYPYKVVKGHACNGVTYDKALDSSFTGGYLNSGNYYLTEDIELTDTLEIAAGSDVKICLNGKNITGQGILNNGTLTLNNCDTAKGSISRYWGKSSSVLNGNAVIDSDSYSQVKDTSKINGCTFNAPVRCYNSSEISNGTFNADIYCHDSSNISGGTFNADVNCLNSSVITGGYFGGQVGIISGSHQKFIRGGYFKTSPDKSYIADGYVVTASGDSNYPYKVVKGHICGGVTYDKALDSSFTGGTLTSGNYYLTSDLSLTSEIRVDRGSSVKICLNGHNITQTQNAGIIINKGTLDLIDCKATGKLSGGKSSPSLNLGGCIYNAGTMTVGYITIDGNSALHGGAVSNYGNMQIAYCTFTNNSTTGDGGAISNSGTMTVAHTKITLNSARRGGGICNNNTLTLTDVTVTGNTADTIGGIYSSDSGVPITISEDIIIKDNTSTQNSKHNDVCINNNKFAIGTNGLGTNSYINVYTIPAPTVSAPAAITTANQADYTEYFHSSSPDCYIVNGTDNAVMLATGNYTVTFDTNGHGTAPAPQTLLYGDKVTEPDAPTADGMQFFGWYKESTCENKWDFGTDIVTADITLYASWCDHSGNTNTLSCTQDTVCSVCGGKIAATGHSLGTDLLFDSTHHWQVCRNSWCGEILNKTPHSYGDWTVTVPATEDSEGEHEHSCTVCGYTEKEVIPKDAHVHSFGSEWKHDENYHWHECACGERTDISAHIPDSGKAAQSGEIYTGTLTYTCTVCGCTTGTEKITQKVSDDIPDYTYAPLYIETGITYEKLHIDVKTDESSVTLSWEAISGAKGYKVYVYDSDDTLIRVKKLDETEITFRKLTNGETYRFVVKYTLSGRSYLSNYSDEAKVTIMYKPFVKVSSANGGIRLSWDAVEGAEKYAVYRIDSRTDSGRAVKLAETTKLSVRITASGEGIYGVKAYVNGKWTTLTTSDLVKAEAE